MKIGVDEKIEEEMIRQVRSIISPEKKILLDLNMAWNIPQAKRLLKQWHEKYNIDFVEFPLQIQPQSLMKEFNSA